MGISEVTLSKEELTSLTEKIGMQKGIVCTWDFLDTSRFIDKKRAEGLTKEKYLAFIEKRQEKMRTRVDWGDPSGVLHRRPLLPKRSSQA